MIYRRLVRPLFFLLPPETAHHVAFDALRAAMGVPGVGPLTEALVAPRDPALEVRALGTRFSNPVGLAAGFDKDAIGFAALGRLGFGHVEVGTLTAKAQPGNDEPRMFRLSADRALINRMGFNNRGSADAARRLAAPRRIRLGVNIGKSKVTPEAEAAQDYARSAARVAPFADYLVVNVSSPNTPGLRNLQAVEKLRPVLRAVQGASAGACADPPPLLVKIAPDLDDADVDAVAELALDLDLAGIVATNTTIARRGLRTPRAAVEAIGAGGLSGAPLKARALEVLERLRRRVGPRLTLIAAGGIETVDDAWARVRAGATLVQVYTGFVYGGPLTPRRLALGLAERARAAGYERVQDAVGTAVDPAPRATVQA
ncbi:MAG TPA: quinone-dependent dihydroorotate dehydrogenase [Sandaracinaceae bacterium LLY-WYZ-13_1]|nr:quinone-dependent dihydroorotate dehydrogenase [Sandaracinaceae bacterium LLY-WYZ-13_1]